MHGCVISVNFTLFEIVKELVSKEEPLYFKPLPQPTLQETLHKSKKRGTQIEREMQWCDKLLY
jgi:hypothetical protein